MPKKLADVGLSDDCHRQKEKAPEGACLAFSLQMRFKTALANKGFTTATFGRRGFRGARLRTNLRSPAFRCSTWATSCSDRFRSLIGARFGPAKPAPRPRLLPSFAQHSLADA